jgi:hypothetical protein
VYWDGGLDKIEAFREQHAPMCEVNWVCNRLGLRQLVVEDADTTSDTDTDTETPRMSSTRESIHRQSINYLVNL